MTTAGGTRSRSLATLGLRPGRQSSGSRTEPKERGGQEPDQACKQQQQDDEVGSGQQAVKTNDCLSALVRLRYQPPMISVPSPTAQSLVGGNRLKKAAGANELRRNAKQAQKLHVRDQRVGTRGAGGGVTAGSGLLMRLNGKTTALAQPLTEKRQAKLFTDELATNHLNTSYHPYRASKSQKVRIESSKDT